MKVYVDFEKFLDEHKGNFDSKRFHIALCGEPKLIDFILKKIKLQMIAAGYDAV